MVSNKLDASDIAEVAKPKVEPDTKVVITMPATDLFDHTHPGVQLNQYKFEPGKSYRVRADVKTEIEDRLRRFNAEQVRLLRPNADQKALNDVNRGSQWTSRGTGAVALDKGLADLIPGDAKIFQVDF